MKKYKVAKYKLTSEETLERVDVSSVEFKTVDDAMAFMRRKYTSNQSFIEFSLPKDFEPDVVCVAIAQSLIRSFDKDLLAIYSVSV